jgi:hypothetical protein
LQFTWPEQHSDELIRPVVLFGRLPRKRARLKAAAKNAAQGFLAPVVLDLSFFVGQPFGVSDMASVVPVDAKGRIASELAVGAPRILALAGAKTAIA